MKAPAAKGASQNNSGRKSQSTGTNLSARSAGFSSEGGSSVKGAQKVPCLNPDPFTRLIGPKNWGEAFIDDELTTCLLDNGAQLNFMTPDYAVKRGLQIFTLEQLAQEIGGELPPIHGIGRIKVKPLGFVIMNVRILCIRGYNEDQIAIVLDDPSMKECPVILGTPTRYRAIQVIKESEITQLAVPWAMSCLSYLIRGLQARVGKEVRTDVGNKNITPTSVDEVVRVSSKFQIPPFGCKAIHGRTGLLLMGYKLNVMIHGLEKKSPQLPLGVKVLSSYATLTMGSNRITVVLRNNTNEWVEVQKGVPIARMVTANMIPPADLSSSPVKTSDSGRMSEEEMQQMLFEKLDLSGLESWDAKVAKQARSLLAEYHDLFSLEKNEIRCTKAAEHVIELKDPDATPFKEWFRRIPPPQVDKVREHLKLMLDAGAI